ncbi:MAG: hypothetical protein J5857_04660 [Treponema sp.]|nr:hypothetical protein [Treponema sp.]
MKRKCLLSVVFSFVAALATLGAQVNSGSYDPLDDSVGAANRRTALRCLTLSKDYARRGDWATCVSQASLGISYDETVSDLWYMLAVAETATGKSKAVASSYLKKAMEEKNWLDYNRDSARLLYADILCDTQRYADVFAVLDGNAEYSKNENYVNAPCLYSADAEYIRIKALYRLGDSASIKLARTKVDECHRMYPNDVRFPQLFFTYENPKIVNSEVNAIATAFINKIRREGASYYDGNYAVAATETEMLAIPFAPQDTRVVLLRSFAARGLGHPRYAILALKEGLISQKAALEYFESYADSVIPYDVMTEFFALLTDPDVKSEAAAYMNGYNGLVTKDTNGDKIRDLFVQFNRGRPSRAYYDMNQDDVYEWNIALDYGVPVNATLYAQRMDLSWGQFPSVKAVQFRDEKNSVVQSFTLVPGECQWTPVRMTAEPAISKSLGIKVYFPELNESTEKNAAGIDTETLVNAASSITVPGSERPGTQIKFILLDGKIKQATYSTSKGVYAQAQFENGDPSLRLIDSDGDGVFETTELYAVDKTGEMEVHSLEEERSIMQNLFGEPSNGVQYYLRMIQVDTGKPDGIPDYTEEFLPRGGKVISWDNNGDGNWDVKYIKESAPKGNVKAPVVEQTVFFDPNGDMVRITLENGVPVKVTSGMVEISVYPDDMYRFYWLGKKGDVSLTKKAIQALNAQNTQGASMIVSEGSVRALIIRMGDMNYGKIIE